MTWCKAISIHALREEGDAHLFSFCLGNWCISIHALREEGDWRPGDVGGDKSVFLSTPSARRATQALYFKIVPFLISIHALREEGDHRRR